MNHLIAIDPGYDRCGVAILESDTKRIVFSTCIETNKKDVHEKRLATIYAALKELCETYTPKTLALEKLFFSVNKKTVIAVAEARGVILLLAGILNLDVIELSPQEIKIAMTGVGNASKDQVQRMVSLTLNIPLEKKLDDEIDAIALGIAAAHTLHITNLMK